MKIFLDKKFIVGLYFFVRQVQLYIDRSFGSWPQVVSFIEERSSSPDIAMVVCGLNKCHVTGKILEEGFLLNFFRRLIGTNLFLFDFEVAYLCDALNDFVRLMKVDDPDREELVSIRLRMARIEQVIFSRIGGRSISRLGDVEHFNQGSDKNMYPIDELAGYDWMQRPLKNQ